MKKIAEIHPQGLGSMVVYYDNKADQNPYRVYRVRYDYVPEKGLCKRTKQTARYADLASCAYELWQFAYCNNEEGR